MSFPDERATEWESEAGRSASEVPRRALTLRDVAALAEADEFHRYELHEGGLIVLPPPDIEHGQVVMELATYLVGRWSAKQVLPGAGVRIEQDTGRIPDLVLTRRPLAGGVWVDPSDMLLAVEVVSPSTRTADRLLKPAEYARAGIPAYWRVERGSGVPTVHMYTLGTGEHGEPAYVGHRDEPLQRLVAGDPPGAADLEADPARHPADH